MDEYEEYVLQEIVHEYAKCYGDADALEVQPDNAIPLAGVGCVARVTNATGRLG